MSASSPSAAGVAPARTNSPNAAASAPTSGTMNGSPAPWLIAMPPATRTPPPMIPYRMIVVRRRVLNRLPQ